ncbi:MAG: hypothetical protein ACOCPS_06335 [Desulfonatronovibrio sp.]
MPDNTINSCVSSGPYVPEHIPEYFCAFSDSDPFQDKDIVYYLHSGTAHIIAYPLTPDPYIQGIESHVVQLAAKLKPSIIKVISPAGLNMSGYKCKSYENDFYFCLELNKITRHAKLRNMLRRASQSVYISKIDNFTREHLRGLQSFIKKKNFDREKTMFFHRLPDYLCQSDRSLLVEARLRKDRSLSGFSVFQSGPGPYGFYLFNITNADSGKIPGINDLLLEQAVKEMKIQGRQYMNMGLGVNPGIEKFKSKWGAVRFLPYYYQEFEPAFSWKSFFKRK